MVMQIINQSQSMIRMPVIYHLGNILIALWRNSSAREIRFTLEHQFCQKLQRDHHRSPLSGEYFVILHDSLTICPWRDHGSGQNTLGTLLWLICSCHSVFLGTSSSGFIYIYNNNNWWTKMTMTWLQSCCLPRKVSHSGDYPIPWWVCLPQTFQHINNIHTILDQ